MPCWSWPYCPFNWLFVSYLRACDENLSVVGLRYISLLNAICVCLNISLRSAIWTFISLIWLPCSSNCRLSSPLRSHFNIIRHNSHQLFALACVYPTILSPLCPPLISSVPPPLFETLNLSLTLCGCDTLNTSVIYININPPTFGTFFIQVDAQFETIPYCGFEWWNNCVQCWFPKWFWMVGQLIQNLVWIFPNGSTANTKPCLDTSKWWINGPSKTIWMVVQLATNTV